MGNSTFCDHCGLPVPGATFEKSAIAESDLVPCYCCFGCRFAAELGRTQGPHGVAGNAMFRLALSVFLSLNVMIFTVLLWTQDVYGDAATGTVSALGMWDVARYLCMLFSLPVLYLLGLPVATEAWIALRRGVLSTDLLLIVGTLAAYLYSIVSTVRGAGAVYFEVGCVVLVLVTLGRWLEAHGKQRTAAVLESLEKLLPLSVHRREGEQLVEIPLDDVRVGDRLVVRAGERIPCDGRITAGVASIDAQLLTGESRPQVRETSDMVVGGTLDLDGTLTIEVTAPPRGGTWRRLLDCVREARLQKGRYEQLADRLAAAFLPLVFVVALGAFAFHAWFHGVDQGLLAGLAVVLIACPCALGLATPMAVWSALGAAAQNQVLFRNGRALERLAQARVLAFDKTGTLTDGRPSVDRFVSFYPPESEETLSLALSACASSHHDLSRAVQEYCRRQPRTVERSCAVRTLSGRGLEAVFAELSETVFLGSERLMRESGMALSAYGAATIQSLTSQGLSVVCIGRQGNVSGVFGLRECMRPGVNEMLTACRAAKLQVCVLTGDHAVRGQALAAELGVEVRSELLPEDKLAAVGDLRRRFGSTVMIGDGINDAPALTAADVGMALGCGTDVSRESAEVCLLGNDLTKVPWAVELARRTVRIVKQNLFWSLAYNLVGIGLAATGRLNPVWAAAAMMLSGLCVVANSLRLAAASAGAPVVERSSSPSPTSFESATTVGGVST